MENCQDRITQLAKQFQKCRQTLWTETLELFQLANSLIADFEARAGKENFQWA